MAWGDFKSKDERRKEALDRELNRKIKIENTIKILENRLDKEDDTLERQFIKDDIDLAKNHLYECEYLINQYA